MSQAGIRGRSRSTGDKVALKSNEAFAWCSGTAWQLYRSFLSGPAELFIPEHTRDAFFQLWCDVRSNVPKDSSWLRRHADALQPRTSVGYVALASFLAFLTAGGTSLLCVALTSLAVVGYALVGALLVAGVTAGFWLLVFSGILLVLSFVVAWTASCLAAGYVFLASLTGAYGALQRLVRKRRSPLQEARQVIDTVKTSKIPTAAYGDELGRSLPGSKTEGLRPTNTDVDGSQSNSTSQRGSFTDDYSPGRAQYQTGIANLHQTREGTPTADAAAMGGPTLAGKEGAAVHPSILPNSQHYASARDFVNA